MTLQVTFPNEAAAQRVDSRYTRLWENESRRPKGGDSRYDGLYKEKPARKRQSLGTPRARVVFSTSRRSLTKAV